MSAPQRPAAVAACYARKSQADDENVAAQVAAARTFAMARGWAIPDEYCYQDPAKCVPSLGELPVTFFQTGRRPVGFAIQRAGKTSGLTWGYPASQTTSQRCAWG